MSFLIILIISNVSFAHTLVDNYGVKSKLEKVYSQFPEHNTISKDDFASYIKHFDGFSYDCSGEICDGELREIKPIDFNWTTWIEGDERFIITNLGDQFEVKESNAVYFTLQSIMGEFLQEDNGFFHLNSLEEFEYTMYEGLPFEIKIDAYVLKTYYYPFSGSAKWDIDIYFDPSSLYIRQILELKLQGETWFNLSYL